MARCVTSKRIDLVEGTQATDFLGFAGGPMLFGARVGLRDGRADISCTMCDCPNAGWWFLRLSFRKVVVAVTMEFSAILSSLFARNLPLFGTLVDQINFLRFNLCVGFLSPFRFHCHLWLTRRPHDWRKNTLHWKWWAKFGICPARWRAKCLISKHSHTSV